MLTVESIEYDGDTFTAVIKDSEAPNEPEFLITITDKNRLSFKERLRQVLIGTHFDVKYRKMQRRPTQLSLLGGAS